MDSTLVTYMTYFLQQKTKETFVHVKKFNGILNNTGPYIDFHCMDIKHVPQKK